MDDCLVGGGGGESQLLGLPSFAIMVCMLCSSNVEYHVRILFLPHRIFCLKTKVLPALKSQSTELFSREMVAVLPVYFLVGFILARLFTCLSTCEVVV